MDNKNYDDEMPVKKRTQRIEDAKLAFSDTREKKDNSAGEQNMGVSLRIIGAGILFIVMVVAFYNDFSYQGFDREYVMERLSDESYWTEIVQQVGGIVQRILTNCKL